MTISTLRTATAGFLMAAMLAGSTVFASTIERVDAYRTDVWRAQVYAGIPVQVTVDGDGDTDLDLYIYDEYGRMVASDDDLTDYCIGSWTPRFTGMVTIRIVNRGPVFNRYVINVRGGTLL